MGNEKTDLRGMKVLIVDDTAINIDVLRQTLAPEGYEISVATSGEQALKITPRFVPDLILLDIMMPGIDGFETCRQLKCNDSTKEIPVIFISAKNETDDIVKGFSLGGVDYIVKPIKQAEVLARVETHLQLQFLKKEQEKSKLEVIKKNHQLQESMEKLKSTQEQMIQSEKWASLGCLTSGICHEVLNPINIISCHTQALAMERENDSELIKDLDSIQEEIQKIERIIEKLEHFVNQEGLVLTKNYINSQLTTILDDLDKEGRFKRISVIREFNLDLPKIGFDRKLLRQVFQNIFHNAICAMNQEGTLTIKTEESSKEININSKSPSSNIREENFVRITVSDTGHGIEKGQLSKIFNPFFTTKPPGQGIGLGLSVCYSIIQKHGGIIKAESDGSAGAKIVLYLPMISIAPVG